MASVESDQDRPDVHFRRNQLAYIADSPVDGRIANTSFRKGAACERRHSPPDALLRAGRIMSAGLRLP